MLLGRTRQDLAAGELSEDELAGRLTHARRALSIVTDYLLRLVHEHPWEDLIRAAAVGLGAGWGRAGR